MSDLLRLRDHSQPCEHKRYLRTAHYGKDRRIEWWSCDKKDCPGGREIVLRKLVRFEDRRGSAVRFDVPVYVLVEEA